MLGHAHALNAKYEFDEVYENCEVHFSQSQAFRIETTVFHI